MSIPFMDREDRFQGYRGSARAALERFSVGVWSEVELVNDRGSVFQGVILPRSETADEHHVVVKLFTNDSRPAKLVREAVVRATNWLPPVQRAITRQLTGDTTQALWRSLLPPLPPLQNLANLPRPPRWARGPFGRA